MRGSDSSQLVERHFLFVRSALPSDASAFAPCAARRPAPAWACSPATLPAFSKEDARSPRFLGDPYVHATVLGSRCASAPGHLALPFRLPLPHERRPTQPSPFGIRLRGLHIRCLRFAARVPSVHARLASGRWPTFSGQNSQSAGSRCEVSVHPLPPRQSFSWRNGERVNYRASQQCRSLAAGPR
jgi:hypothetical protein